MRRDIVTCVASVFVAGLLAFAGCSEKISNSYERLLNLSSTQLEFVSWAGTNPNPAQKKVIVKLDGSPATEWTASTTSDWLRIGPQGTDTIYVSVISTALSAGVYDDTITVEAPKADNSPLRVAVHLSVLNQVTLSPAYLTFSLLAGDNPPPAQELVIANFGSDSIEYVATSYSSRIILSSTSGIIPDTLEVTVDVSGMSAGHYVDSIVVTSPDLPQSRAVVPVHMSLSSWSSIGLGQSGVNLEDVQFVDAQTGFTSGWSPSDVDPHGHVYRTDNGGTSWTRICDRSDARFGGLAVIDAEHCLVVGSRASIFRTINGGDTWEEIESLPIDTTINLRDIVFADASHGWAMGGQGRVIYSIDSGKIWTLQSTPTSFALSGAVFLDTQTGWISGDHGTILHTGDGGQTWVAQSSGTILDLRAICFVDSQHGWAVGSGGTILGTANGGATWTMRADVGDVLLVDVAFVDQQLGWVVGLNGSIYRTDDGGSLWVRQSSGTTSGLTQVFFLDGNLGWAVGDAGT
ncbi:MAG: YCF48-related protein, partial [candidate division Zixibacteria bacterium]|nr:YCF48-related protein [candidate division Zixibacteria bacterium]